MVRAIDQKDMPHMASFITEDKSCEESPLYEIIKNLNDILEPLAKTIEEGEERKRKMEEISQRDPQTGQGPPPDKDQERDFKKRDESEGEGKEQDLGKRNESEGEGQDQSQVQCM